MDKDKIFWPVYGLLLTITTSVIIYVEFFNSIECKKSNNINGQKIQMRKIQGFVENFQKKGQDKFDSTPVDLTEDSDYWNEEYEEIGNKKSDLDINFRTGSSASKKPTILDVINYKNLDPQSSWCKNYKIIYLNSKKEIMMLNVETGKRILLSVDFYIKYNAEELTISWDCEYLMIAHSCKRMESWYRQCKYVVRHINTRRDFAVSSQKNILSSESPFLLYAVWGYHGNNLAISENGSIYAFKNFEDVAIKVHLTNCLDYFCGSTDLTLGTFQKNHKGIFWHKFDFGFTYLCYNLTGTPRKRLINYNDETKEWKLGNKYIRMSNSLEMLGDQRPSYYTFNFKQKPIRIQWQKCETKWGPSTFVSYFGISSIKTPPSTYWVNVITNPVKSVSSYATCYKRENGAIKCKSKFNIKWGDLVPDVKPGPYFVPDKESILGIFPGRQDFQLIRKGQQSNFHPFLAAGGCNMKRTANYQPLTLSYRSEKNNPLYIKFLIDFNENEQEVYVTASTAKNYSRHDIWFIKLNDTTFEPQCLTCKILVDCLEFKASTDPLNWKYFLVDCHGPSVRHTRIFSVKEMKLMKIIDENNHLWKRFKSLEKPRIIFLNFATRHERINLRIKLYLPSDIMSNEKLPLLLHTSEEIETPYAGYSPSFGYSHYLTLIKRWAVIEVDGRGKNLEGFKRMKPLRYKLGIKDLQDYSDAVMYILQKYESILDVRKIGVWGKGYGGYTAASLIGAKPVSKLIFKCGAALSPLARWSNLSHTFFHSYFPPLTNPWESTDPLIYTRVDLLHRIRTIRNDSFLLMHGALQRDVPLEQSMWLSRELFKANVNFEQMIFPDFDFSKEEEMLRVYYKLDDFFTRCFTRS